MPVLIWDKVGSRSYETGLDKGVLYLPDRSAVPWNGLTSIIEKFNKESSQVYYDGMKINELISFGDFSASMKAVTYPDEFIEIEGLSGPRAGLFYDNQKPKTFGLCYRTQMGNDLEGDTVGYKIHILYNVTAVPHEKTYASVTASPSLVEFEWDIYAVPEELEGFSPTAHIIINSVDTDPWLLEELEEKLYGSNYASAVLIPMQELVTYINDWYRVKITDNGNGTWTATAERDGFIFLDQVNSMFTIMHANAIYLNDTTYQISDTRDLKDIPLIKIDDNGNGTWTATTEKDGLIIITGDTFEIRNANVEILGADSYSLSDTVE